MAVASRLPGDSDLPAAFSQHMAGLAQDLFGPKSQQDEKEGRHERVQR
jgi:hypothetical protein